MKPPKKAVKRVKAWAVVGIYGESHVYGTYESRRLAQIFEEDISFPTKVVPCIIEYQINV